MDKLEKEVIQVTKELVVKFIEAGRVSPANFNEVFRQTYSVVSDTILHSTKDNSLKNDAKVKADSSNETHTK
ncbi:hypothetical protein [Desulfovibrio litoralis]|uniref:Conjugal transfer protein TraB n=1 Tax=Desulfovibrio litoralis DSM 11393 TaxID=1121455 RepID=A0A1M7RW44_9BACT|nr:hypothetical protein [Desulfovibrio litoralis]SHN50493.1 hypothetical protein SAMN02745728_00252 [Desulfovibrio litoralis DSM 11393]